MDREIRSAILGTIFGLVLPSAIVVLILAISSCAQSGSAMWTRCHNTPDPIMCVQQHSGDDR